MSDIEFRLPWPPSVNTYYTCIRSRKVLSKKGRMYSEEVKKLISEAKLAYGIDQEVYVELGLAPPRNYTWDGDNREKPLFDALTKAGFWKDDSLVRKCTWEKLPKYAFGEVYISVTPWGEYNGQD